MIVNNICTFYLCANAFMMAVLRDGLQQRGIDAGRIHSEAFGVAAAGKADSAYRISIKGYEPFLFQGLPTLLHGLEQAGIAVDSDCRAGRCGACRVKVIEGRCRWLIQPEHLLPAGEVLACCAAPQSDLHLVR